MSDPVTTVGRAVQVPVLSEYLSTTRFEPVNERPAVARATNGTWKLMTTEDMSLSISGVTLKKTTRTGVPETDGGGEMEVETPDIWYNCTFTKVCSSLNKNCKLVTGDAESVDVTLMVTPFEGEPEKEATAESTILDPEGGGG